MVGWSRYQVILCTPWIPWGFQIPNTALEWVLCCLGEADMRCQAVYMHGGGSTRVRWVGRRADERAIELLAG